MTDPSTTGPIDWAAVREKLPASAHDLVDDLARASEANEDPARAVELELRERLAGIRKRFEALQAAGLGQEIDEERRS